MGTCQKLNSQRATLLYRRSRTCRDGKSIARPKPDSRSPLHPRTLIRENERTARDEIGRPIDIAGRNVVKISIRFT